MKNLFLLAIVAGLMTFAAPRKANAEYVVYPTPIYVTPVVTPIYVTPIYVTPVVTPIYVTPVVPVYTYTPTYVYGTVGVTGVL